MNTRANLYFSATQSQTMININHRYIRVVFISLFLINVGCNSKRDGDVAKEELTSLIAEFYAALANKDDAKVKELTAANFVLFDDGLIYNVDQSLEMIRQLPSFKASFSIDSANAHIGKNDASMYYFRKATFTMADSTYPTSHFLESATFLKVDDEWKIRFMHSTTSK